MKWSTLSTTIYVTHLCWLCEIQVSHERVFFWSPSPSIILRSLHILRSRGRIWMCSDTSTIAASLTFRLVLIEVKLNSGEWPISFEILLLKPLHRLFIHTNIQSLLKSSVLRLDLIIHEEIRIESINNGLHWCIYLQQLLSYVLTLVPFLSQRLWFSSNPWGISLNCFVEPVSWCRVPTAYETSCVSGNVIVESRTAYSNFSVRDFLISLECPIHERVLSRSVTLNSRYCKTAYLY